jgi:hypothetical protein
MFAPRLFCVASCSAIIAGCALHPIQEQVTDLPTADIVRHIKCEAQQAIQEKAKRLLTARGGPSAVLAKRLEDHPEMFKVFHRELLPDDVDRKFFDTYIETGMAFDFTFDITEDDSLSAQVSLASVISKGTFGLSPAASGDYSRQNIRRFVVSDTFRGLLHMDCSKSPQIAANYAYPISGNIGLAEVISTFIDLNRQDALAQDQDVTLSGTTPVFADSLFFITTLTAGVNPGVSLAQAAHGWSLTNASITASASRTDKHDLIIGLSLPPKAPAANEPPIAAVPLGSTVAPRSAFARRDVPRGGAEERALLAVSQQRLDVFYDKLSTVVH